jgi:hypothetical protein
MPREREPARCFNCGRPLPGSWPRCELRRKRTGEIRATWLCEDCRAGPFRAWRLAWRLVGEPERGPTGIDDSDWRDVPDEPRPRGHSRQKGRDLR